jgi:hypothetical protein
MHNLDELAPLGVHLTIGVGDSSLGEVADLTLRLHLMQAQRAGAVLTADMLRSYAERSEVERDGMRSAVLHVLKALVLLDIIEVPGG